MLFCMRDSQLYVVHVLLPKSCCLVVFFMRFCKKHFIMSVFLKKIYVQFGELLFF
jgi:hypothetical protein